MRLKKSNINKIKTNYEAQLSINLLLKSEIEKKNQSKKGHTKTTRVNPG